MRKRLIAILTAIMLISTVAVVGLATLNAGAAPVYELVQDQNPTVTTVTFENTLEPGEAEYNFKNGKRDGIGQYQVAETNLFAKMDGDDHVVEFVYDTGRTSGNFINIDISGKGNFGGPGKFTMKITFKTAATFESTGNFGFVFWDSAHAGRTAEFKFAEAANAATKGEWTEAEASIETATDSNLVSIQGWLDTGANANNVIAVKEIKVTKTHSWVKTSVDPTVKTWADTASEDTIALGVNLDGTLDENVDFRNFDEVCNAGIKNTKNYRFANWNRPQYGQELVRIDGAIYMHMFRETSNACNFYFDGYKLPAGAYKVTLNVIKGENWTVDTPTTLLAFSFYNGSKWYEGANRLAGADITAVINAAPAGANKIVTYITIPMEIRSTQFQLNTLTAEHELWFKDVTFEKATVDSLNYDITEVPEVLRMMIDTSGEALTSIKINGAAAAYTNVDDVYDVSLAGIVPGHNVIKVETTMGEAEYPIDVTEDVNVYGTEDMVVNFDGMVAKGETSYNMDNGDRRNSANYRFGNWNRPQYGQEVVKIGPTSYMHLYNENANSNFYFDGFGSYPAGKYEFTVELIKSAAWTEATPTPTFRFVFYNGAWLNTEAGSDMKNMINAAPTGKITLKTVITLSKDNVRTIQLQFGTAAEANEIWIREIVIKKLTDTATVNVDEADTVELFADAVGKVTDVKLGVIPLTFTANGKVLKVQADRFAIGENTVTVATAGGQNTVKVIAVKNPAAPVVNVRTINYAEADVDVPVALNGAEVESVLLGDIALGADDYEVADGKITLKNDSIKDLISVGTTTVEIVTSNGTMSFVLVVSDAEAIETPDFGKIEASSGCGSVITLSSAVLAATLLAGAMFVFKKKED